MTASQKLFVFIQHLVPQHLLSRCVGWFASTRIGLIRKPFIRTFIRIYDVDMGEAAESDPDAYANFNDFFTRALQPGARAQVQEPHGVASPADGTISQLGIIHDDDIYQAKGHSFSLAGLLGGDPRRAEPFRNGVYATIYLSPRDYHRVHMPYDGRLREMVYVPGKLFSVNDTTAAGVPGLFARNERMVSVFDTDAGPMAVVMVGAMIVAGIETVWAGRVAPVSGGLSLRHYDQESSPIELARGAEMGRFFLGSTVIVLFGPGRAQWAPDWQAGSGIRLGELLGRTSA